MDALLEFFILPSSSSERPLVEGPDAVLPPVFSHSSHYRKTSDAALPLPRGDLPLPFFSPGPDVLVSALISRHVGALLGGPPSFSVVLGPLGILVSNQNVLKGLFRQRGSHGVLPVSSPWSSPGEKHLFALNSPLSGLFSLAEDPHIHLRRLHPSPPFHFIFSCPLAQVWRTCGFRGPVLPLLTPRGPEAVFYLFAL